MIAIEFNKDIIINAAPNCADVIILESVNSTNTYAREKCREAIADKTMIIALNQTAGRGRSGKSFYSPQGGGLYMSLVLNAESVKDDKIRLMTICAAVAVCDALKKVCGIDVGIKWVNDIFYLGRKVCGILCEAVNDNETLKVTYYIVGIGINIGNTDFPKEIKNVAGSILCPKGAQSLLAAKIAEVFFDILENTKPHDVIVRYRSLLMMLDKEVSFTLNGKEYNGTAKDISEDGGLKVDCDNEILTLSSGEISLDSAAYTTKD